MDHVEPSQHIVEESKVEDAKEELEQINTDSGAVLAQDGEVKE